MIYDTLNNLPNYLGLCSSLDSVIEFIMARDINNLPAGRTRIDGDKAVVMVSTVTPQASDKAPFVRHDSHLTLETDLEGSELFEVSLGEFSPTRPADEAADTTVGTAGNQHCRNALRGPLCPLSGRGAVQIRLEGPGLRQAEKSRVHHGAGPGRGRRDRGRIIPESTNSTQRRLRGVFLYGKLAATNPTVIPAGCHRP